LGRSINKPTVFTLDGCVPVIIFRLKFEQIFCMVRVANQALIYFKKVYHTGCSAFSSFRVIPVKTEGFRNCTNLLILCISDLFCTGMQIKRKNASVSIN
jgi:hypothetical protein